MSITHLLNKTCTIQTKTETQGDTGSFSASWANTYELIPVRYSRARSGNGRVQAGSFQVTLEDFIFYFESNRTISIADRIVVDGLTFEVTHVFSDSSDDHLEVLGRLKDFD